MLKRISNLKFERKKNIFDLFQVQYGGRVTDDFDKRLLVSIYKSFFSLLLMLPANKLHRFPPKAYPVYGVIFVSKAGVCPEGKHLKGVALGRLRPYSQMLD